MATGHHKYADFNLKDTNKYPTNANKNTVEFHLKKGVFKNSKKAKKININTPIFYQPFN